MSSREDFIELISTDFSKFFHDPFLSSEQINQATTQTGYITIKPMQTMLETGIQSLSNAKMHYNNPIFNPVYSTLQFKVRMSSMQNVTAFFGFSNDPTLTWAPDISTGVSRFNGFLIQDGVLKIISRGTVAAQMIEITDMDMTDVWLLKIENDKFYARPLPQIYPYFDGFLYEPYTREWKLVAQTSTQPPEDINQYLHFTITNSTGANRTAEINHITFGERYVG